MQLVRSLRSPLAALALAVASCWSHAQITAAATMTGPLNSVHFNATVVPTPEFLDGNAKLWVILLHQGVVYVHSGPGGFVVYQGGEAPAFRAITSARESIDFQQWDLSGMPGTQIYVGYGRDMNDMLNNGRFAMVHQVAQARPPAPPAPPPPAVVDPMASYSGSYTCYNEYYIQSKVNVSINSSWAVVDTSAVYDIPYNSLAAPYKYYLYGSRIYSNNVYPRQFISLDHNPGALNTIGFVYQYSEYSSPSLWNCRR